MEAAGGGIDTIVAGFSYTLGAELENLTAAAGAGGIALTGNGLANVVTGNDAANSSTARAAPIRSPVMAATTPISSTTPPTSSSRGRAAARTP